jgi:hypothetical protein
MISNDLKIDDVPYMYDQSGRICIKGNKVYRIIENEEHIKNYKELLNSDYIEELFSLGLVRTKIAEELDSRGIIILEHQKIPFILHPCEYSNKMFWQTACMFIEINLKLAEKGFVTQDSHPWNVSFDGVKPVYYDFGSIIRSNKITQAWFDEFLHYFIVSIWLASYSPKTYKFAKEYRKENGGGGFGVSLFKSTKIKKILFWEFRNIAKFKNDPQKLFSEILKWLQKHEPISVKPQYWSNYYETNSFDYTNLKFSKQKFVYKILADKKPEKVLDLASNKGYYAFMAANLGASVVAFDYEEEIVDFLLKTEENTNNKVTPAHMDFSKPTAPFGPGLFWEDSFKRFESEIVLALGLIHHICITQGMPVYLFCETCKKYATKGVLLEFADPTDRHVANWNAKIPKDYSIDKIKVYMKDKFPNCEMSENELSDGINRTYLYFYN